MLFNLLILFQLFYSITCQISCYECPIQSNTFNSILTADTIPNEFKDCTMANDQSECAVHVIWTKNPDQTQIIAIGGGERRSADEEHNLQNTITLTNTGNTLEWRKDIAYVCSTDKCNNPSTLKRLLKSLQSTDNFNDLLSLLQINPQFNGDFCSFFTNSSVPCETEMDKNTCKRCAALETIESGKLETCLNCLVDDLNENFITRQVKFFMNNRERHDIWMIECQQKDCNTAEIGDLIRQESIINFDFNLFLNSNGKKLTYFSWIFITIFILKLIN